MKSRLRLFPVLFALAMAPLAAAPGCVDEAASSSQDVHEGAVGNRAGMIMNLRANDPSSRVHRFFFQCAEASCLTHVSVWADAILGGLDGVDAAGFNVAHLEVSNRSQPDEPLLREAVHLSLHRTSYTLPELATGSYEIKVRRGADWPGALNEVNMGLEVQWGEGAIESEPNRAPTLAVPDARRIRVGEQVVVEVGASDPDGDALELSVDAESSTVSDYEFVTNDDQTSGRFTWTATSSGSYQATIGVSDGSLFTTKVLSFIARSCDCSTYGCAWQGGGCNSYGCYDEGGGCNSYGCWETPGAWCNSYGCYDEGGGCNSYGCWDEPGAGCNSYGCYEAGGGCNSYGCWQRGESGCNSYSRHCDGGGASERRASRPVSCR